MNKIIDKVIARANYIATGYPEGAVNTDNIEAKANWVITLLLNNPTLDTKDIEFDEYGHKKGLKYTDIKIKDCPPAKLNELSRKLQSTLDIEGHFVERRGKGREGIVSILSEGGIIKKIAALSDKKITKPYIETMPEEVKALIKENTERSETVEPNTKAEHNNSIYINKSKPSPTNTKEVEEIIQVLSKGGKENIDQWNLWRIKNPDAKINLDGRDFSGFDFRGTTVSANLSGVFVRGANFSDAILDGVRARGINAEGAIFDGASMNDMDVTMFKADKETSLKNIGTDKINAKTLNTAPAKRSVIFLNAEEQKAEEETVHLKNSFAEQNPGVVEEIEAAEVARLQKGAA